jgi:hypothetical protein
MHLELSIPWLGSILLESVLLFIIFRKHIYKSFPIFASYVVFDLLRAIIIPVIASTNQHFPAYFYSYWISVPIEYTLTLFIILEVLAYIFSSHIRYSTRAVQIFALMALLLFAVSVILVIAPDIPTNTMTGLILTLDRSAQLLICGLLLFMWVFSRNLGLQWRHHVWGIVFGLAIYSSLTLVVAAVHATTGEMCPGWITPLPHFSYLGTIAIWIGYLIRKEPEREPLALSELTAYQNLVTAYRTIIADIRKVIR